MIDFEALSLTLIKVECQEDTQIWKEIVWIYISWFIYSCFSIFDILNKTERYLIQNNLIYLQFGLFDLMVFIFFSVQLSSQFIRSREICWKLPTNATRRIILSFFESGEIFAYYYVSQCFRFFLPSSNFVPIRHCSDILLWWV